MRVFITNAENPHAFIPEGREWFSTVGKVVMKELVPSWNERLPVGDVLVMRVFDGFAYFRTTECERIERPFPEGTVWTWREQKQP